MGTYTLFLPMLVLKGCEFSHKDMKNYKKRLTFIALWGRSTVWGLGDLWNEQDSHSTYTFFVIVGSKIVLEGSWPCNGSYLGNCGVYFVNRGENENSEVSLKRGVWHLLDQGVWDRKLGEQGEQTVAEERWGKVRIVSFKVLDFKQYKLRN